MSRFSLDDLAVFVTVGQEGNFTRAAAKLGVSPSAVSQTIRGLEERLGVRLLTRTTRSVTRTEAGEKLLASLGPMLEEIHAQLNSLQDLRENPSGTIRICADEMAIEHVLWPKLRDVLHKYPDITLELITDNTLSDIVAQGYDAGVRLGQVLAADMIAVAIGPEMRVVTVAAPSYLAKHPAPTVPKDLTNHQCINFRLPTYGGLYPWEFSEDGRVFHMRVEGQLVSNSVSQIEDMVLDGYGIAQLADAQVQSRLDSGELVEVLSDWSETFTGYHLYYPHRRQPTAAFRLIVDALRERSK